MIKNLFGLGVFLMLASSARAQVALPSPYSSPAKINYIRTWDAMFPTTVVDTLMSRSSPKDVRITTQYIDGLGRPIQTVVKKGSQITDSTAKDLVSPVLYDDFGREQYKYLPFVANTTGGNSSVSDGLFKLNPFHQDSAFNKAQFSDETHYYGQTVFETSPLNRVLESYAPGNNWVGTAGEGSEASRRGVKMKYWVNTVTDSVKVWNVVDVSNSFGTYTTSSVYAAGLLLKNISQDEHNKQVIEFKDNEGKVILKKVQLTADADTGTGKGYQGWLCTYYIYDNKGQLRCVVQPHGVELLAANSWAMSYSSGVILAEQCFRYEYDLLGRMMMKRVPGAGTVYMIYDARDRMVMSQDSVMRAAHKWMYTLFDALNRPTTTGLITDATNNATYHRSHADTSTTWPNPANYTDEQLTKTFYDDYSWRSGESNPLTASRSTSYDSYLSSATNTLWPYAQDATSQSNQLRGRVTGTKTKVLDGGSTYLYSVIFYDNNGRVIQTQNTNYSGGTDINTVQYSWVGQPLLTIAKHEKAGTNAQTSIVLTKPTFDDLWRMTKTEKKIGTTKVSSGAMPGGWTTISQIEYDALGQLKKKKLGATPVDSLNYEYNIRGWMLGMNRAYVKDTTSTTNWFGFDLGYDKTSLTVNGNSHSYTGAQYNGNINGMLWRSTGDDYLRKYDFTYDAASRFLSADFNQLNSNSFSKAAGINFSVSGMGYDANGNIQNMNQKGWKLGGSVTIDSLLYGYTANTNRLHYVHDRANDATTKLGDFKESSNNTSQDYSYDANGNMNVDNNKNIGSIFYNYLNLPDSITVTGKGGIRYVYDAAGNKLKKKTTEGAAITTTLYMAANYVNDTLQFVGTEEGRARIKSDNSAVVYDYMIKDHVGNVRMVLTEETKTDYYPQATMEVGDSAIQQAFYTNLSITRENKPAGWECTGFVCPDNFKVAKVNGGGNKIGPAIILKVMAGDKFDLMAYSYWYSGNSPNSPANPLNDLLSAIGTSAVAINGGHPSSSTISGSTELTSAANAFLNSQSYNSYYPKAYINWVLFDERFNYVSNSSGFEQVGGSGSPTLHTRTEMPIAKSGYLYIYVSNATDNIDVYFDDLQVNHIRGPLLSEDHYYPFGLAMAGIHSNALNFGGSENKKKYNNASELQNREFADGSGLEMYGTLFRNLDPQLGRWWQLDPRPSYGESPYASMGNNPISNNDPLGDTTRPGVGSAIKKWLYGGSIIGFADNLTKSVSAMAKGDKRAITGFVSYTVSKYSEGKEVLSKGTSGQKKEFLTGVLLDAGSFAFATKLSGGSSPNGPKLGDLTKAEVKTIQGIVNEAGRPIDVVGSAASGTRRGVGTDLPLGKGPGTKSDIDFAAPYSSFPYLKPLESKLPSIDLSPGRGIIGGGGNPFIGPFIKFEPFGKPTFVPAQQ